MSSSVSKPCLSMHDVRFSYKAESVVLQIESLELEAGRKVFLHGPSGSGKSTLLSVISGIVLPQRGKVEVLGQDLAQISATKRDQLRGSDIGYIFQGFNLIPYLTVEENIALPCSLHEARRRRIRASSVREEILRLTSRLDIQDLLHEPVTDLSTGQQQRVAIARAIIGAPPLVIADEPTSSLDQDRRDAFLALLTEMVTETQSTLIFVSHDLTLIKHFEEVISLPSINRAAAEVDR